MSQNIPAEQTKQAALSRIESINAVEGFNPMSLALEFDNLNDGSKRCRLPVKVQMAWFRLKYPEGRIAVSVNPENDCFIAEARIYINYKDPKDCFLAEGSASRGFLPDKPTVSPREWAQTAAIGMALRNAGFGLNADIAGESFEDNTLNELAALNGGDKSVFPNKTAEIIHSTPNNDAGQHIQSENRLADQQESGVAPSEKPSQTPLEMAMAAKCPISKHSDKTLGDLIRVDPGALAYIAKSGAKYGEQLSGYATTICEYALQQQSA